MGVVGSIYSKELGVSLVTMRCGKCDTPFAMSEEVYRTCKQRPRSLVFYCPNGHEHVFTDGESDLDKMRRERDRLAQQIAQRDDEIKAERKRRQVAERQVTASRAQVTKMKTRAGAGVCQCCNRTFVGLARHMKTKHPNFKAEAVA